MPPVVDKHENAADHTAILREIKALREDAIADRQRRAEEIKGLREDLKEVVQVSRTEHKEQIEELKGWLMRVDREKTELEKELIEVKNAAENAKRDASKNSAWQGWGVKVVLGAIFLGLIGLLTKGGL